MITSQSLPLSSTSLLIGLAAILCTGCASGEVRQQAAYDRKIQRTEQLLIASGDADSLAAAAMLSIGPKVKPVQRLTLIARAVAEAPERPDLVWLNVRLCAQVEGCDSEPLEARLRALDPDNGAAWSDSIGRAGKRNDVVAVRKDLEGIATSTRFDTYWNATIVHVANAILRTHTMDLPTALVATIGMASAMTIPAYQTIVSACKGDPLKDPSVLNTCRQVSSVMRGGDTYLTEMIGVAIAKRAWPEGSAEYVEAVSAKRVAHYQMDTDGKIGLHHFLNSQYAAKRLQLMTEKKTEQEVNLAEILNAKLNPNPPSDWTDRWGGS
ncbi:MAG TPA: hypothetical protein VNR70_00570 [Steroidobacteraceae bacterium]|nr:hypothetical protein [Steroidobacteraceae bacterium]